MQTQTETVKDLNNPLVSYLAVTAQIKNLEAHKALLRDEIESIMNLQGSDTIQVGENIASRKMVVQTRIDTQKVKEILGDDIERVQVESEQIRLTVK